MTPIKVLLLSRSIILREVVYQHFSLDTQIQMLPPTTDQHDALTKLARYRPDIIIIDDEGIRLSGLESLIRNAKLQQIMMLVISSQLDPIQAQYSTQSIHIQRIAKPIGYSLDELMSFVKLLIQTSIYYGTRRQQSASNYDPIKKKQRKIVAIGAGSGQTNAVVNMISKLPSNCPPIIVIHEPPLSDTKILVEQLKHSSSVQVKAAEPGDRLRSGTVLVAPAKANMSLAHHYGNYEFRSEHHTERIKPSINSLFFSLAETMGKRAVGILFQGNENDGVLGLMEMNRAGAKTFIQVDDTPYRKQKYTNDRHFNLLEKLPDPEQAAERILLAL